MQQQQNIETYILIFILAGTTIGFLARWWMLRGDIRQYPTKPNGYLIHLTAGFIAAAMGAVLYPSILMKNYTAVTFLALAIQQFREIRRMEKEALISLEKDSYAPRGAAYIDGISKTFEARNYIALISSFATTLTAFLLHKFIDKVVIDIIPAILLGALIGYLLKQYTKGHTLKEIITIEEAPLVFKEGSNLYVGDIYVMNVGLSATKKRILENGIGLILKPKNEDENEKVILNQEGQRTAIIHECARILGLERYSATRRDFNTGRVAVIMVPIIKDVERMKDIILNLPILETVKKNNVE